MNAFSFVLGGIFGVWCATTLMLALVISFVHARAGLKMFWSTRTRSAAKQTVTVPLS